MIVAEVELPIDAESALLEAPRLLESLVIGSDEPPQRVPEIEAMTPVELVSPEHHLINDRVLGPAAP